jgi:hypothetical protein
MHVAGLGVAVLCLGGFGLPISVPPQPETPLLAKVAPEECLFYMSFAGMADADAESSNKTERIMAEPAVQKLGAAIGKAITSAATGAKSKDPSAPPYEDILTVAKAVLTQPAALYVSRIDMGPKGPVPCGGAIIKVGDDSEALNAKIEEMMQGLPPEAIESLEIGGQTWQQLKAGPVPLAWGFRGKYLVIGFGDGELEAMLKRAKGTTPAWLTKLRKDLAVDRLSTVTYVNMKAILPMATAAAGPRGSQVSEVLGALGLSNVGAIRCVTGLDETGFVNRMEATIAGQPQGLFSVLTAKTLSAADLASVPQDASFAFAAKLDLAEIWKIVASILQKTEPGGQNQALAGLGMMEQMLQVKLQEDVFQSLSDTWIVTTCESQSPANVVATVSLKDPQKFAGAYAKIMAVLSQNPWKQASSGGSAPTIAKDTAAGRDVYTLTIPGNMSPAAPSWCATDKELVFAMSPKTIAAHLSRSAGAKSLAAAPDVASRIKGAPAPSTLAYINLPKMTAQMGPALAMAGPMAAMQLSQQGIALDVSVLPPAVAAIQKHLTPDIVEVRRTSSGVELIERGSLPGVGAASTAPVMVALLLPAVQAGREAARRMQSTNNLKQIGLSMHNYLQANKTFPAAYTVDKSGKPLLSWRVLILPYLEQNDLYKEFHLDEPWDSEHNKKLIARMSAVYGNPNSAVAGGGKTNYLAPRGDKTIFANDKGTKISDVTDGTSNTIVTLEVPDNEAVVWTKPDDFKYDENAPMKGLLGMRTNGFIAGLADGSVRFFMLPLDPTVVKAMFTRNGGEKVAAPN